MHALRILHHFPIPLLTHIHPRRLEALLEVIAASIRGRGLKGTRGQRDAGSQGTRGQGTRGQVSPCSSVARRTTVRAIPVSRGCIAWPSWAVLFPG